MRNLSELFKNNKAWAGRIRQQDPEFFAKLSQQQVPSYLWIGCSDSRVPANQIIDVLPGVDILKVRHVIVCGHYGCSGVLAALRRDRLGLSDNWLRHLQDVREKHEKNLAAIVDPQAANDRLCELNVIEQVINVCQTTIARDAWLRGQELTVHGWIYGLRDGLLHDLNVSVTALDETMPVYHAALAALP